MPEDKVTVNTTPPARLAVRIVRSSARAALVDARDVVEANWRETGFDMPFNPSLDFYDTCEKAGTWFAFAAMLGDELIGYSSSWVTRHPFNPEIIFASTEALYVKPEHRKGLTSGRLILATEREAKARGANKICWNTSASTSFASVLKRHGYEELDVVVMKGL